MVSFLYAFFSILSLSENDFSSKMQNLIFSHSYKDILKSDRWKFCFVRNDQQPRPTVSEMNSKWLCMFFICAANLQKRYFPSYEYLPECRNLLTLPHTSYIKDFLLEACRVHAIHIICYCSSFSFLQQLLFFLFSVSSIPIRSKKLLVLRKTISEMVLSES